MSYLSDRFGRKYTAEWVRGPHALWPFQRKRNRLTECRKVSNPLALEARDRWSKASHSDHNTCRLKGGDCHSMILPSCTRKMADTAGIDTWISHKEPLVVIPGVLCEWSFVTLVVIIPDAGHRVEMSGLSCQD